METIRGDPQGFIEEGGWDFLDMNENSSNNSSEEESEFKASSSDSDSEADVIKPPSVSANDVVRL
jgi:nucleosome binding factor SPN SPT16 subunit